VPRVNTHVPVQARGSAAELMAVVQRAVAALDEAEQVGWRLVVGGWKGAWGHERCLCGKTDRGGERHKTCFRFLLVRAALFEQAKAVLEAASERRRAAVAASRQAGHGRPAVGSNTGGSEDEDTARGAESSVVCITC
jgi:hypothetical protein